MGVGLPELVEEGVVLGRDEIAESRRVGDGGGSEEVAGEEIQLLLSLGNLSAQSGGRDDEDLAGGRMRRRRRQWRRGRWGARRRGR